MFEGGSNPSPDVQWIPERRSPAQQNVVDQLERAWSSPATPQYSSASSSQSSGPAPSFGKSFAKSFSLAGEEPNSNYLSWHLIAGLSVVASFMLAVVSFKKFQSSQKPAEDPFLYSQMA